MPTEIAVAQSEIIEPANEPELFGPEFADLDEFWVYNTELAKPYTDRQIITAWNAPRTAWCWFKLAECLIVQNSDELSEELGDHYQKMYRVPGFDKLFNDISTRVHSTHLREAVDSKFESSISGLGRASVSFLGGFADWHLAGNQTS